MSFIRVSYEYDARSMTDASWEHHGSIIGANTPDATMLPAAVQSAARRRAILEITS